MSWSISVDVGAPGASMPEAELAGGGPYDIYTAMKTSVLLRTFPYNMKFMRIHIGASSRSKNTD